MDNRPRILLCMPVVTGVTPKPYFHQAHMWMHIGRSEPKYRVNPAIIGPRRSPRDIRNNAGRTAVSGNYTHLFFLDDDILPPANIVDLLLDADKPIIGGLVRKDDGLPIVFKEDGSRWPDCPRTGIFKCGRVGLGVMMIKAEVLMTLCYPWFFFRRNDNTMDVNFCDMAQDAGIEVWCSAEAECEQIRHEEQTV